MSKSQTQRSWFARHKVLTAAGAVVVVVAIGAAMGGGGGGDEGTTPEAKSSAPASSGGKGSDAGSKAPESKAPEEKKAVTIDGDGDFEVGSDVKPGLYRTTGNEDAMCYWERSKDAGHGMDAILANDNVTGTAIVKITAKDGYFKSVGCGDWTKTS
ncbi:hypothetical protein [Streptomyces hydrogenans]|uniref:hypothetical protein n=1 Tax=Streptomyces hydrogenans TaxID=1873719 RepID=UPI0035DA9491